MILQPLGKIEIMKRRLFKSKIHRATVTQADVDYEGSISIDELLMDAADIVPYEEVHIWDVTNGARLITYALPAERGSGVICINGAAAHLINPGNLVIIATFTEIEDKDITGFQPTVVFVNKENSISP